MNIQLDKIQVLGNRILIKPDPVKVHEIVTAGGLVTAAGVEIRNNGDGIQRMEDIEPPTGRVVKAGTDCKILKEGDRVLFSPFSGKKLTFMLEDYLLMVEVEPVMKIND